ncbi:MAG: hypothetical protein P4L31_01990 [Candidatus Babeliales bacterium]|nr:hypothetical protein [Candidatus Babeliales bacterium]
MTIKNLFTSRLTRLALGSGLLSSFTFTVRAMLVNSKEIAHNVKNAIIEAGTQCASDFKDAIETTKPLWPNKYSCLTSLGVLCAAGGLLFLYQGISQIINSYGQLDNQVMVQQGVARITTGLLAGIIGIIAIYLFGG